MDDSVNKKILIHLFDKFIVFLELQEALGKSQEKEVREIVEAFGIMLHQMIGMEKELESLKSRVEDLEFNG